MWNVASSENVTLEVPIFIFCVAQHFNSEIPAHIRISGLQSLNSHAIYMKDFVNTLVNFSRN
jgi:hypothetical protein